MTSVKFELPERYKRQLKIRAAQDGITLTKLVLGSLYAAVPPTERQQRQSQQCEKSN